MKLIVTREYLGKTFTLTLESDVTEDVSAFDVESRITKVMNREVQRFAEISAVALQDKTRAEQDLAERIRRKHAGEPKPERGPSVVLAAGTKDEKGRAVVEGVQ
jgi:hypothetical protein